MNTNKYKLNTKAVNGGPFNTISAMSFDVEAKDILINNVVLPGEFNPHNVRLWIIGDMHDAIVAVWADCEQDALDEAVDANRLDALKADEQDYEDESLTALGNASELFDISLTWIREVEFVPERDTEIMLALASENVENLMSNNLSS